MLEISVLSTPEDVTQTLPHRTTHHARPYPLSHHVLTTLGRGEPGLLRVERSYAMKDLKDLGNVDQQQKEPCAR